jgi:hypothetical protein
METMDVIDGGNLLDERPMNGTFNAASGPGV